MKTLRVLLASFAVVAAVVTAGATASRAQLAIGSTFNPSQAADLCGLGFDRVTRDLWVYGCGLTTVQRYTAAGAFVSSALRPGEVTNDVDLELPPAGLTLGPTPVPEGSLIFINGGIGTADFYVVDKVSGTVTASLASSFGNSEVVGGAYHSSRGSLFLVQSQNAAAADANRVAEIDPVTGAILGSFQTTGTFAVDFGDLDVCATSGNLFLASNVETRLAEFTPTGAFVQYHALPASVLSLSAIGIDDQTGDIWVGSTQGPVWRLTGGACAPLPPVPALQDGAALPLALGLFAAAALATRRKPIR